MQTNEKEKTIVNFIILYLLIIKHIKKDIIEQSISKYFKGKLIDNQDHIVNFGNLDSFFQSTPLLVEPLIEKKV